MSYYPAQNPAPAPPSSITVNFGLPPPNFPPPNSPQSNMGDFNNYQPQQQGYQQPAVSPTAPDFSKMQVIPGYEGLTSDSAVLVPPSLPDWQPDQREQKPLLNVPALSEEDVHDAACQFAAEHCCYASKPARDMNIREINMINAYHYKLETFSEKRESSWKFEPYSGQIIDGPQNGPAPSPWDIPISPAANFKNAKVCTEVPHTAFMKPCHTCVGNGRVRCETCMGNGQKQCTWCSGRGRRVKFDKDEICSTCNGTGWERCFKCTGTGQVKCRTCDGRGNLKGFVELVVTWTNKVDDYISETSNMPKELVLQVTGQVAFEEEHPRVYPITTADPSLSRASKDLVQKHNAELTNERMLKQKHCLRVVPIGNVRYEWKQKMDEFYIYGFEHKVYFKKYPQRCLCTIL